MLSTYPYLHFIQSKSIKLRRSEDNVSAFDKSVCLIVSKYMITISTLLLLCIQLHHALCQYPVNMSANLKYAYSGKYIVDIQAQTQKASSTNWDYSPPQFTIPYPKSLASSDSLAYPILNDFSLINIFQGISVEVYLKSLNGGTAMTFNIYTSKASNIQKISIAYLILYNYGAFVGNFAPYSYTHNLNSNISKNYPYIQSIFLPAPINETGGVSIYGAIAGVYATPTNSIGTISIVSTFTALSQFQMGFKISSLSDDPTYVKSLAYVVIIYNQGYLNESTCKVYNGIVEQSNSNYLSYSNEGLQMQSLNTFIGLTSFQIDNQSSLQFFVTLNTPHFFWANSSKAYSYFSVSYIIIWCQYCDYRNPYLYTQDNLCYLSCPASSAANQTSLQCNPCFSNCFLPSVSTSSQGFPVNAIILISIARVVAIAIVLVIIYFKCLKKNQEEQSQPKNANLRKVITFRQQEQIVPQSQRIQNQMKQPRFYPINNAQFIHKTMGISRANLNQQQIKVQIPQQQWKAADQNIKFEQACFCSRERPYLRCACNHNFHLTCILNWLLKDKKERRCPLCRQHIPTKAEFYCNKCRQYYKVIDLDFLNEDRGRTAQLQINCPQCPI